MTFADFNLNTPLLNAITDMGMTTPTLIQERAFSVIMSGKDVLGIAQTGTGKTIAYLLPLLRMWKYTKTKEPQIVIMVPTRELVVQVVEVVEKLSTYQSLVVKGVYGGVNMKTQALEIADGMDVLVATPGRLRDLALDGFVSLRNVKKLVIDEVDEMLDLGFRVQLSSIFDIIPAKRQNLLFSATITPEVEALIQNYFTSPQKVEAAATGTPLDNITQQAYVIPNFTTKLNLLEWLLGRQEEMTRVLVFCATKKMADYVFEKLEPLFNEEIGLIHSGKAQNYRFRMVTEFQGGERRILIATDLVSRGLDISNVSHVINFDLPDDPETYIHRIGRTGRADENGDAISFITPRDEEKRLEIEILMNMEIPNSELPEDLEISDLITDFDKNKVKMKNVLIKTPKASQSGPAFQKKAAHNQKTNKKVRRADQMKAKYGKPKTRGQKRK
ncbi:DEAD/DEAH box helicase [Geofilum sp. OHC36d9]|uniref:DEAD/DEAH box helicase n=1 Tax=Geofilum sp. OHC36d9 TaxID=3458413 RepID=UPI0040340B6C